MVSEVAYNDKLPWDPLAAGAGPSLELICVTGDAADPLNWRASTMLLDWDKHIEHSGSPGGPSSSAACPAPKRVPPPRVFLSEIMYHPLDEVTDEDIHEFVELVMVLVLFLVMSCEL